jgi:hypothetical protein
MRSHIFAVAVVVQEKQAQALAELHLLPLLVAQSRQLAAAGLTQALTCLLLRLLALQTLVMVRHIKHHCLAVFTPRQHAAHKTALKLLLAGQ